MVELHFPIAELHFYYGTMNSQKSADLLMKIFNHRKYNKTFLLFQSALNTRDEGFVVSRALNFKEPALTVPKHTLGKMYTLAEKIQPQFVYVDEVSLMSLEQIEELGSIADDLNIPVYTYGLLVDFQSNLFPASRRLMEIADVKKELTIQCMYCSSPASQNMRVLDGVPVFEGEVVKVGGNDDGKEGYRHVCRSCYKQFKKRANMQLAHSM